LRIVEAGRGDDQRRLALQANIENPLGRFWDGEVDDRVALGVERADDRQLKLVDAGQEARVFMQVGTVRRIDRGHDLEPRIARPQSNEPSAHPPRRTMNGNG
jgi:hypothetical protein